jgi:hypothetical protein
MGYEGGMRLAGRPFSNRGTCQRRRRRNVPTRFTALSKIRRPCEIIGETSGRACDTRCEFRSFKSNSGSG